MSRPHHTISPSDFYDYEIEETIASSSSDVKRLSLVFCPDIGTGQYKVESRGVAINQFPATEQGFLEAIEAYNDL